MKRFALFFATLVALSIPCYAQTAIPLRQSTARTVLVGPFVDRTDATTAETGLGGNGGNLETNVLVSKNFGTLSARNSTSDPTHDTDGWYTLPLSTTDVDTAGPLLVECDDGTTYQAFRQWFYVMPAQQYDSLYPDASATADMLQVDTREVGGTVQTAGDVIADTNDVQNRLPAALTAGGNMKSDMLGINGDVTNAPGQMQECFDNDGTGGDVDISALNVTAGAVIASATGDALQLTSSGSNGDGVQVTGNGSGSALRILSGAGASASAIYVKSQATASGIGVQIEGSGTGDGDGVQVTAFGTGEGLEITAGDTGNGVTIAGGATSGTGLMITAPLEGHGASISATGAAKHGINVSSSGTGSSYGLRVNGTAAGLRASGSTDGDGVSIAGGTTSGDGLDVATTNGDAVDLNPAGSGKFGVTSTIELFGAANAEPSGAPAANATLAEKIAWMFKNWRNGMTVTTSERTLLNDNGTEDVDWELSDDGTTTTVSEANAAD